MVTQDNGRGIYDFQWAPDSRHLLYPLDQSGNENWHCWCKALDTGPPRDLTPFTGVRAQNLLTSPKHPTQLLIGLNRRDPRVFDVYRVDLNTGAVALDTQNPGDVLSWTTDEDFVIRAATAFDQQTARTIVRVRDTRDSAWRDLIVVPFKECNIYGQVNGGTLVAGFAPGGKSLYVVSPLVSDKTRLVEIALETGKEIKVLAEDQRCDVNYTFGATLNPVVLLDPKSTHVQAVQFNYLLPEWKVVDPVLQKDFEALGKAHRGTVEIRSRDRDDQRWLVSYTIDDGSTSFYLYDRKERKTRQFFVEQPALENYRLAHCEPVIIKSRDGLDLVSYLTLPPGATPRGLPLVLFPHGGPWYRDSWGFNPVTQWLANRGYAVLQVNYRASVGFGKTFLNAGNRQFGDHSVLGDLLDGVRWAVDRGIADRKRVGVFGGSFGGYQTLCCISFHPEIFACAIELFGPSNIATSNKGMPSYWNAIKKRWVLRLGDAEHDLELNRQISPLYHVENIRAPLLIGHGANDSRVLLEESEQIVRAMRANNLRVTFVVYPDEGHGFARPQNNLDFYGRVEEFLKTYLGGRCQPWEKVPGATGELR
jgi:dipeptidyl aminopeptidase/acylaminoacyl peptidase